MPSEQRLHPVSILFGFGQSLARFAIPGLIVLVAGRSSTGRGGPDGEPNWEVWMMLLLIPAALHALARYLSFRLRYDADELVIRSGIVFRNVRHVPYARIQNLEAVRNLFHRALGVVEIRVETASGKEPEATISVVPLRAFDEMRRRVFEGRPAASAPSDAAHVGALATGARAGEPVREETLLTLSWRDLLLCGFIENKGLVVIGALYGALWEFGPLERFWSRILDDGSNGSGMIRETAQTIAAGRWPSADRLAVAVAGIVGFLLLVRAVSMGWALVRLYGFRLSTRDQDLRADEDLQYPIERARRGFALLRSIARELGRPSKEPIELVREASTSYCEACVSFCERSIVCREHALVRGDPAVLGQDMAHWLGEIDLHRALHLLDGGAPAGPAEEDLVTRMREVGVIA
jgi:putative membrane protein